jgi:hypothetical protein
MAALCALALNGCKNQPNPDSLPTAFQVINGVQDSGAISASVNGKTIFGKIKYGDSSGLYGAHLGHYALAMTESPENAQPLSIGKTAIDIESGRHYTAVAYGVALGPAHVAIFNTAKLTAQQRKVAQSSGKSTVRVFNAAVGAAKIDVLVNSIVAFKNVGSGERSDAIPLAALPDEWSVKPAGDSDDIFGAPVTLQLKSGRKYVVVIMGSLASNDLQIKAFEE